jgi:hypothetical protein
MAMQWIFLRIIVFLMHEYPARQRVDMDNTIFDRIISMNKIAVISMRTFRCLAWREILGEKDKPKVTWGSLQSFHTAPPCYPAPP